METPSALTVWRLCFRLDPFEKSTAASSVRRSHRRLQELRWKLRDLQKAAPGNREMEREASICCLSADAGVMPTASEEGAEHRESGRLGGECVFLLSHTLSYQALV